MDRSTINKLKQSTNTTTGVNDNPLDVRILNGDSTTSANVDAPTISITQPTKVVTIRDHSKLTNLDFLHSGHTGFAGIVMGTTAQWNAMRDYRPPEGMLVVYTDYQSYEEQGETIIVPGFKIGDGNAYLIDKPFVGEADSKLLHRHLQDAGVHIQPGEREFWNNKLNYEEPEGDLLKFTRN